MSEETKEVVEEENIEETKKEEPTAAYIDVPLQIAKDLSLKVENVNKAINLLDEGHTVPFIARYRKEETGGLTDENLRGLEEKLTYYRALEDRKKTVFAALDAQKVDDPVLRDKVKNCLSSSELEDLYRPYKPKKVTKYSKALKAGLKPLADYLRTDKTGNAKEEAKKYITEDYPTVEACLQGAYDIIEGEVSDNPNYRTFIKNLANTRGRMTSQKISDADNTTYDNYADYDISLSRLRSYNVLAINRGVNNKVLTKKILLPDEIILAHIESIEIPFHTPYKQEFTEALEDAYKKYIYPSVTTDIFSERMDKASEEAILEFKASLKAILLAPPLKGKRVLGFDPGFSHGCKLAFIDENGKLLHTVVLEDPYHSKVNNAKAKSLLPDLLRKYKVDVIACGNGTASRESQAMLREIKEANPDLKNVEISVVSEAGASIYSAQANAQKEFPNLEPNLRSAVSIARRLQDPLAELVKIPPVSIGVGQYQYDINSKKLHEALSGVVEDCVNFVGVQLNTASADLLSYVSGISSTVAKNIVDYRDANGAFHSREELKKVKGIGAKAFENAAGFLRIPESKEPLDNTAVHPESYPIAKAVLKEYQGKDKEETKAKLQALTSNDIQSLATKLNVGVPTLTDILHELIKPSRDPREKAESAHLDESVKAIEDLKPGQILEGTIRNVTGFGFFVDIGVEKDGLVYLSEITNKYITDPHPYGKPGDIIKVRVLSVDIKKNRISLSMKNIPTGEKKNG